MNKTIIKVQSQLPYFMGFYNSVLEPQSDLERDLESGISEEELTEYYPEEYQAYRSAKIVDCHYDEFSIYLRDKGKYDTFSGLSYKEATRKIAEYCVDEFFNDFLDIDDREDLGILAYNFSEVDSPRFYNYSTDKCIYDLELDLGKFKYTLKSLILDNKDKFQEILDGRHKSRSGFTSFYSDRLEDWLTFESKNVTSDGDDSVDNIMVETYLIFYSEIIKTQHDIDNLYLYASYEALS
jgi:hypothetical protein